MNKLRILMYGICTSFLVCAMETEPAYEYSMKPITTDIIKEYKQSFPKFLKNQESNLKKLRKLPSKNSGLFGKIVNTALEGLLSFCGLGNVDLDEARAFLGRTFDDEQSLHSAIDKLEQDEKNVHFLDTIFSKLDSHSIAKRSRPDLTDLMKRYKHPRMPDSKIMDTKDENGNYIIKDDDFFPFAACQLFALHLLEHDGSARVAIPKKRKSHQLMAKAQKD